MISKSSLKKRKKKKLKKLLICNIGQDVHLYKYSKVNVIFYCKKHYNMQIYTSIIEASGNRYAINMSRTIHREFDALVHQFTQTPLWEHVKSVLECRTVLIENLQFTAFQAT